MSRPLQERWRAWLEKSLPTRETLTSHAWLRPIAHRLLEPRLWQIQHEAVARGVAIGIFWAFAIPFAQFIAATAHSVWWRANIPVAAGVTLITNPLTAGLWLWLAYQLGSLMLDAPPMTPLADSDSLMQWLAAFGAPAVLGMAIFALVGAAAGYLLVKLAWRVRIWFKRRGR